MSGGVTGQGCWRNRGLGQPADSAGPTHSVSPAQNHGYSARAWPVISAQAEYSISLLGNCGRLCSATGRDRVGGLGDRSEISRLQPPVKASCCSVAPAYVAPLMSSRSYGRWVPRRFGTEHICRPDSVAWSLLSPASARACPAPRSDGRSGLASWRSCWMLAEFGLSLTSSCSGFDDGP